MTSGPVIPSGRLARVGPTESRWGRRELAALVVVAAMCGCKDLREANADAIRTEATIRSELGANAHVEYRTIFTPSGRQAVVIVKMESGPPEGGSKVSDTVNEIVRRTFHARIDKVDVLYRTGLL